MKCSIIASLTISVFLSLSIPVTAQDATEAYDCAGGQILSIAPVVLNNTGPGAGISYEHMLDAKSRLGFNTTVYFTYGKDRWHYNDFYNTTCVGMLLSFKYYTASCKKRVRYALGFGIPLEFQNRKSTGSRSPGGYSPQNTTDLYFNTGLLFHNSLEINISRRVLIGLNANLGLAGPDEDAGDIFVPFALLFATAGLRL